MQTVREYFVNCDAKQALCNLSEIHYWTCLYRRVITQEDAFACHMETICFWARYRRIGNEIHYSAGEHALLIPSVIPSARHVLSERESTKIHGLDYFLKANHYWLLFYCNVICLCVIKICKSDHWYIDIRALYLSFAFEKMMKFCQYICIRVFSIRLCSIFAYVLSML